MKPHHAVRNIVIFSLITLTGGFAGMALDRLNPPADSMQGLGTLLWLVSPLAANLLLRWLGGDGWQDFGLKPHFKSSWVWYLAALAIVIGVTVVVLGAGSLLGTSTLAQGGLSALWPVMAVVFASSAVKNIFEEFAWRGYLTPRFAALGLHPFANALLTGVIWAGWHIPYYLFFLNPAVRSEYTSLSAPAIIALSLVLLPLHSLAYGELRLLSKSVWTVWLLHTAANAVGMGLVSSGFVVTTPTFGGVLLSPGTEGILYSLLMGGVGLALYRYRLGREGQAAQSQAQALPTLHPSQR